MGAIPYSRIKVFAEDNGLEDIVRDAFVDIVSMIDISFLKWVSDPKNKPKQSDIRIKPT